MFVDSISWQEHHHGRIIEIEAEMETFVHRVSFHHPIPFDRHRTLKTPRV